MWGLAGSVARVLKSHALGRALKNDAASTIFSCESAGRSSKTKILEAAKRASISDWQSDEFWHFLANFG